MGHRTVSLFTRRRGIGQRNSLVYELHLETYIRTTFLRLNVVEFDSFGWEKNRPCAAR